MKKEIFILFLFLFVFTQCKTNPENKDRWDSKNYIYSNFDNNFTWELPDMDLFKWKLSTGNSEHTVFKAIEKNSGTVAFVNMINADLSNDDLWSVEDQIRRQTEYMIDNTEKLTGEICEISLFKACLFCGKRAIKTVYTSHFKDDRYEQPIRYIYISYQYVYHKSLYTVAVKINKDVYDVLNYETNIFFKYGLLPQKEDL